VKKGAEPADDVNGDDPLKRITLTVALILLVAMIGAIILAKKDINEPVQ